MKTLNISNGEIRLAYELSELNDKAKSKAISEHLEFMDSLPDEYENENGELVSDEYVEHAEQEAIDSMEANEYLFDEDGDLLPLLYYTGNHPKAGTILFNNKYDVTIS